VTPNDLSIGFNDNHTTLISQLTSAGAHFIYTRDAFLDSGRRNYLSIKDGIPLYCDHDHLSTKGANMILLPILKTEFSRIFAKL